MIRVINRLQIKKGHVDEVLEKFSSPKAVHTFDGFVTMEVLEKQNVEDHDELHIATTWEDEASFEKWRDSRRNAKVHAKEEDKDENKTEEESPILDFEISMYTVHHRHMPQNL